MKKNILKIATLIVMIILIVGCNSNNLNKTSHQAVVKQDSTPMVGGDIDKNGCKGSAGYQWSIIKNKCIRLFEDGIRLDAKQKGLDATFSAFIVFRDENIKDSIEVFLPNENDVFVLIQDKTNGAGKWINDKYELSQWKGVYTLETKRKKEILYQGVAAK